MKLEIGFEMASTGYWPLTTILFRNGGGRLRISPASKGLAG
jgi:hypothetical protein